MPAWIPIAVTDLRPLLVAEQLDALRTEALAPGQPDPFVEIAPAVVAKVRAFLASNPGNAVDSDPATIPPELKLDVCYLVIAPMMIRLNQPLTTDQQKQIDIAHTTLIALRDRKLLVSRPDDAVQPDVQGEGGVEVARTSPRAATRESLAGL